MTQTVNVTVAREHWSQIIGAVFRHQQRVVLAKAGIPAAALVPIADLARLRRYDAERAADMALVNRIGDAFADIPDAELEREVALAVEEARAELRAEREQVHRSA